MPHVGHQPSIGRRSVAISLLLLAALPWGATATTSPGRAGRTVPGCLPSVAPADRHRPAPLPSDRPAWARPAWARPTSPIDGAAARVLTGADGMRGRPAAGRSDRAVICPPRAHGPMARIALLPLPGADDPDADPGTGEVNPQPVPYLGSPRWAPDSTLAWRWSGADPSPAWLRDAVAEAANDVVRSRRSRAPSFRLDPANASGTIRYTSSFPDGPCITAIACASQVGPDGWWIRVRPHGTRLSWGTLRWCQVDPTDGCLDVERVMLHEMGHVIGLDHPENAGLRLGAWDTIMLRSTPSRPRPTSSMHAYGPCDVAALQERYDVPGPATPISSCNDVAVRLGLGATASGVGPGDAVTLVASLRIVRDDAYGRLSGNALTGRTVELRRRTVVDGIERVTTFWLRDGANPGFYRLTIAPDTDGDYQAVFRGMAGEGLRPVVSIPVTIRVRGDCTDLTCPAIDPEPAV